MITGGAMESAIEMDVLAHDIKQPNDVETFAIRQTTATAIKKYDHPSRNPIIGYEIEVNIMGMRRNNGSSASVFPKKYALL